jgi:hypothetical protein
MPATGSATYAECEKPLISVGPGDLDLHSRGESANNSISTRNPRVITQKLWGFGPKRLAQKENTHVEDDRFR